VQYAHPPLNAEYPIVRVGCPAPECGCAPFTPECGCTPRLPLVPECACESVGAFQLPSFNVPQLVIGALVGVGLGYVFFATK